MSDKDEQYLYAYHNTCYDNEEINLIKIGSTNNPANRFFNYMTLFPKKGKYIKVIKIEKSIKNCYELDAQLQNDCRINNYPFIKADLGGGQEFYTINEINNIFKWLDTNGVKYKDVTNKYINIERNKINIDHKQINEENNKIQIEKQKIINKSEAITKDGLREYQKNTIDLATEHYKVEIIGNLIYICGAGKTVTSYYISNALDARKIVIFVPTLYLASQFRNDWYKELKVTCNQFRIFLICHDATTNNEDNIELLKDSTTIKAKLKEDFIGTTVAICTYQSHKKLINTMRLIRQLDAARKNLLNLLQFQKQLLKKNYL
jgi:hypothetical protein